MHHPILRKDTKADRYPPPVIITDSPYSTDRGEGARAAAKDAADWLAKLTKDQH